jgi:L-asparaginase
VGQQKIVVLGTGGTIAGTSARAGAHVGYTAGQVAVADLLTRIPALAALSIETEQVSQVDSKDMTAALWQKLAGRCTHHLGRDDVAGIVITHGTDTIEETAYYLNCVLPVGKPVALTCAMRPATAISPDGPQNIADALAVASHDGANGVVVVCAGVVHGARHVTKVHHYRLDPFSSGDAGPIGYVEDGNVRLVRDWPGFDDYAVSRTAPQPLQRVEIVVSHAGASRAIVDALVAAGVQGIVVAGTGNGSVHEELLAGLIDAQARGVKVLRASRCAFGGVIPVERDVLASTDLSPVKARIQLMLDA